MAMVVSEMAIFRQLPSRAQVQRLYPPYLFCKILHRCKLFHLDRSLFPATDFGLLLFLRVGIFLNLQEVVTRYIALLLASLLTLGCGMGSGNHDPHSVISFSPPSIATLTPNSVPVNSVPFTMTINGSNFGTDALVFWNGTPQFTIFVTSKQLMANVTDTDLLFAGLVPIYVRTGGLNSNTVDFNVAVQ